MYFFAECTIYKQIIIKSYPIYIYIDWKEGLYTLLFRGDLKVEQLYLDRKYRSSKYLVQDNEAKIENSKPIRDSWCSSKQFPLRFQTENHTNGSINQDSWQNKTVFEWNLNETMLNDQFRLCLDYHHYHHQNRSTFEAFSSDIVCRVVTFHYDIVHMKSKQKSSCEDLKSHTDDFTTCSFLWNDTLKMGTFVVNSSEERVAQNNLYTNDLKNLNLSSSDTYINVMCYIKDNAYFNKYTFNQPIIVSPPENQENSVDRSQLYEDSTISNEPTILTKPKEKPSSLDNTQISQQLISSTTKFSSLITKSLMNNSNHTSQIPTLHSDTTLTFLFIILVLCLVGSIFLIVQYYRRKERKKFTEITWEMNRLYHSVESVTEENDTEESVLPLWLTSKPDMIYQAKCIEQSQPIGHGQYGTVYKGKLQQGNAV